MSTTSPPADRDLIRRAQKLGLIDTWSVSDTLVILSKESVTYRLTVESADRFLRALIRSSSPAVPTNGRRR